MGFYRAEVRFYEEVAPRVDIAAPARVLERLSRRRPAASPSSSKTCPRSAEAGDMLTGATARAGDAGDRRARRPPGAAVGRPVDPRARLAARPHAPRECSSKRQAKGSQPFPRALRRLSRGRAGRRWSSGWRRRAGEAFDEIWRPPFVVAHGDYRLDNMLFGTTADAPPVCVVDWQVARNAPPGIDLAVFLAHLRRRRDAPRDRARPPARLGRRARRAPASRASPSTTPGRATAPARSIRC